MPSGFQIVYDRACEPFSPFAYIVGISSLVLLSGFEKRLVGDITTAALGVTFSKERYGYFDACAMPGRLSIEKSGKGKCAVMAYDRDVTDAACNYLRTRKDERPLFLLAGLYGPHPPYVGPEELYDYYFNILPDQTPLTEEEYEHAHPFEKRFMEKRNIGHETAEEIKRVRAAYYSMVEYEDTLLGEILEAVEESLDMDNTLIIYSSDHGDCIGAHGLFWKSNMREGALRIPMIFSWRNRSGKGIKIEGLTSLIDLAPTLLEVAQASQLPVMDGESILPVILDEAEISNDKAVLSEVCDIKGDSPAAMIRIGKYKLCQYYGYDELMLFDLEADPGEMVNLSNNEDYRLIVDELLTRLQNSWNQEEMYVERLLVEKDMEIRRQWAEAQNPTLFYDEWKQVGGQRNQNYLIINGIKVFD